MPTSRTAPSNRRAKARLLMAGVAVLALGGSVAYTQQSPGLRGTVSEQDVWRQLRPLGAENANTDDTTGSIGTDTYLTSSAGDQQNDAVFGSQQGATFADLDEPGNSAATGTPGTVPPAPIDEDITTGNIRVRPLEDYEMEEMRRATADNARQGAIEDLGRPAETSPFEPVGMRLGTFDFFPSLEQGIGWTSNAGLSPDGQASAYSESTLRLDATSDWSRHSASLSATGTYRRSISGAPISDIEGGIDGQLRLELVDDFSANAGFGYAIRPEAANAPGALTDVATRPNRHTLTGSAGIAKDAGPARLAATARVRREMFDNARLVDDTIVSQRERNSTLVSVVLRGGYAISPAITPFIEGEIGRRFQDVRVDSQGFERSANHYALRGGIALDLSEKLTGEIAAGWLTEKPDDANLSAISGLSLEGNLNWSPVRGTTVGLTGTTAVEGTTTAGDSGTLLYSGSLSLSRDVRADLTATATLGADYRHYPGSGGRDLTLRGETSLTWWLNRYSGLVGRLRHEEFRGATPERNANATSVFLGLRAQR